MDAGSPPKVWHLAQPHVTVAPGGRTVRAVAGNRVVYLHDPVRAPQCNAGAQEGAPVAAAVDPREIEIRARIALDHHDVRLHFQEQRRYAFHRGRIISHELLRQLKRRNQITLDVDAHECGCGSGCGCSGAGR